VPPTEQDLLAQYVRSRDPEAFSRLAERHQNMVFAVCLRILRNTADAEDAAQNAFLQLVQKAGEVHGSVAGWLHRVAVGVSVNALRRNQTRRAREARATTRRAARTEPSWEEVKDAIDLAIERLPEDLRVPLVLHYLERRTQQDIARELGISQPAVSQRLKRGVAVLQTHLRKAGWLGSAVLLTSLLVSNTAEAAPSALTTTLGKMALAGHVTKTAATIGGISVMKASIAVTVAAALVIGGVVAKRSMSAGEKPTPGKAQPASRITKRAPTDQAQPQASSRFYDYRPMLEFAGNVRYPTDKEIASFARLWPTVPWHQNAAYYYARAAHLARKMYDEGYREPAGSLSGEGPYLGDKESFTEWLNANRPVLNVMKEGLPMRVCKLPPFIGQEIPLSAGPILAHSRELARRCCDAAFAEELNGHYDAAAEWCLCGIRMGSHLFSDGTMIEGLVGIAITSINLDYLNRLIANQQLSQETLRRVIAECRGAESLPDGTLNMWDCETALQNYLSRRMPGLGDLGPQQQIVRKILSQPLPEIVSPHTGIKAQMEKALPSDNVGDVLIKQLVPALQSWVVKLGRTDLTLRVTELRAALVLYQRQYQKLPDSLVLLFPEFLPRVPDDPFVHAPLHYEKIAAPTGEAWRIWSVGEDQTDDRGTLASPERQWGGPDYVFSSQLENNEQARRRRR